MSKKYTSVIILTVMCSLIILNSSGAINSVSFNQMSLYSDSVYNTSPILDTQTFTPTQIKINKAIYGQSAVIFSQDHLSTCYGDVDTPIFNSLKENLTPLLPLAFSVAEWGGNGDISYSFTPAIATKKISSLGIPMSVVNPLEINTLYYESMGINFSDKSYLGPLQINKSYLTPVNNKGYRCGYIPLDYYSWPDVCQWTFHDKCEQIKNSWNKNYTFKNEYEVVAHTSIAHNSGGTHLTSKDFQLDCNWYPWKSSQAVFDYVSYITNENNLTIILDDADNYANTLIAEFKQGTESGALYKSIASTRQLSSKMNIDWNLYVKSKWLNNMTTETSLSGDALRNWEKTMYPIQSIWNYRVLEKLYGIK